MRKLFCFFKLPIWHVLFSNINRLKFVRAMTHLTNRFNPSAAALLIISYEFCADDYFIHNYDMLPLIRRGLFFISRMRTIRNRYLQGEQAIVLRVCDQCCSLSKTHKLFIYFYSQTDTRQKLYTIIYIIIFTVNAIRGFHKSQS